MTPELNLYDKNCPIWTYQEQAPPCKFVFDDDNRRGVAIDSLVSSGCIISGANVKRSVLFNDVQVESGSIIRDSVILHGVRIGKNCRIKNAIIDNGVKLPDNTFIGEDPEHDRRHYHVSPGGVELVTPQMLGQQVHFEV